MDRGDDLLESTRFSPKLSQATENPDELFENARILHGEGLIQEAKRTLHRALARNPEHRGAKELLESIQQAELQSLLHSLESSTQRPSLNTTHTKTPTQWSGVDVEAILARLDLELGLELRGNTPSSDYAEFVRDLERAQVGSSIQDRIDLGVAFFTMDFFELAIQQWDRAARSSECSENPSRRTELAALRALAYLLLDRPFDAQGLLDGVLVDQETDASQKVEVFYLMGRVRQSQGATADAARWYRTVFDLDPLYRDVGDRLAP